MTHHSPRMTPPPPGHSLSWRYWPLCSGSSLSPEGQWKEVISLHSQPRPGNFPSGCAALSYVWLKWKDCRHTNLCGVLSGVLVYFPGPHVWNEGRPLGDLCILTTHVVCSARQVAIFVTFSVVSTGSLPTGLQHCTMAELTSPACSVEQGRGLIGEDFYPIIKSIKRTYSQSFDGALSIEESRYIQISKLSS